MKLIAVHDGRAHVDDYLAACVLLYKTNYKIFRGFKPEFLEDEEVYLVDQGFCHDPNKRNFDHHQIKEKVCALTLVLDYIYPGIDYRSIIPAIRFIEVSDSFGGAAACSDIGINFDASSFFNNPMISAPLEVFSGISGEVTNDHVLSNMHITGRYICKKIESFEEKMKILKDCAKFSFCNGFTVLDTTECICDRPDMLPIKEYCKLVGIHADAILAIDMRKNGCYRLISTDTNLLKFKESPLCYFVHQSGFLACFSNKDDYESVLNENTY